MLSEAVVKTCSVKKVFLKISQYSQEKGLRPDACNFITRETLAQVFSCEFCEISKNNFLHRTPLVAASVFCLLKNGKYPKGKRNKSLLYITYIIMIIAMLVYRYTECFAWKYCQNIFLFTFQNSC